VAEVLCEAADLSDAAGLELSHEVVPTWALAVVHLPAHEVGREDGRKVATLHMRGQGEAHVAGEEVNVLLLELAAAALGQRRRSAATGISELAVERREAGSEHGGERRGRSGIDRHRMTNGHDTPERVSRSGSAAPMGSSPVAGGR
jgi:hypothetical protein